VFQYGQARIWFAMSRDRLLPSMFSRVHPKFKTPDVSTWVAGFVVGIPAGLWDIATFAELANIGTLAAFASVSAGVLILRKRQPDTPRGFKVPFVPVVPYLSIAFCLVLMLGLPLQTWLTFFIWLVIGLAIYFGYSKSRSPLAEGAK
jgi:basic amino acid/polyamine antiporter, APA family